MSQNQRKGYTKKPVQGGQKNSARGTKNQCKRYITNKYKVSTKLQMANIAVYSGSFNPLHIGHLAIIKHLIEVADYDMVYLSFHQRIP